MKPGIVFSKIWSDDDMMEFRIIVSDGQSSFTNQVYVGRDQLNETVSALEVFKSHVHGGIYDVRFGEFGPEYASGAFHARLQFQERGIIHASVEMEADFREFGKKVVASRATLYIVSEPALLDNFIGELAKVSGGKADGALLEGV